MMTASKAVLCLMALGWIPCAAGEILPKGPGPAQGEERQCMRCLKWRRSKMVVLSKVQRCVLCEDCR